MSRTTLRLATLATLTAAVYAQDISGDWQGEAGRYRYLLQVPKPAAAGSNATLTLIDQHLDW
ncbi:MAG TPA: hypothetical protein VKX49_16855 [Bryobacteraceae bacterium]|nr:hypothetical protein [Bryobacteraceae bacterium]